MQYVPWKLESLSSILAALNVTQGVYHGEPLAAAAAGLAVFMAAQLL